MGHPNKITFLPMCGLNLAASKGNKYGAEERDLIAAQMTSQQIEQAQKLAQDYTKKRDGIMQMLFIDESGTPPSPDKANDSPPFVLGGIIISDQCWHLVKADLESIKEKYKISGEIKWRFFCTSQQTI